MKRRDFLKTSVGGAAGLALGTPHSAMPADQSNATLQLGLIGVGFQGRALLSAARGVPDIRFRAICDIWPYAQNYGKRYLARYGHNVTTYADYRRMLEHEKDLDAVLIATPDFMHARQAIAALEAGRHVYCEPMLAHTIEAAQSMVRAMQQTGKLLQVGYQRRSDPKYRHVCERLIREAELPGPLTNVQTQWAMPVGRLRGWPQRFEMTSKQLKEFGYQNMTQLRNWIWYPTCCVGPYGSFVSQQLDVCDWMLQKTPRAVLAAGGGQFYPDRPNLDTVTAVYEYQPDEEGTVLRATCTLLTNTSGGGTRQFERFLGTEGSIQISENPRWIKIGREATAPDWDAWLRKKYLLQPRKKTESIGEGPVEIRVSGEVEPFLLPPLDEQPRCQPHLVNFFNAIRGQAKLRCPADAALRSQAIVHKTMEAIQAKRTLEFRSENFTI